MLTAIITALTTASIMFLISLIFYKNSDKAKFRKIALLKIAGYKVHHSVFGIVLILLGLLIRIPFRYTISEVGLGVYICHIAEEMYVNKKDIRDAIFVFTEKLDL